MAGFTHRPRSPRARVFPIAYLTYRRNFSRGPYSPNRKWVPTAVVKIAGALYILFKIDAEELFVRMGSTGQGYNGGNRSERKHESVVDVSGKEMLSRYVCDTDSVLNRLLQGGTEEQRNQNQISRTQGIIYQVQGCSQKLGLSDNMPDGDTSKGSSK